VPKAREHTALPPVLLQYFANGDYCDHGAPPGGRLGTGAWEAFDLSGKLWVAERDGGPLVETLYDQLLEIWQTHTEALEAAAPPGYAPMIWSMLLRLHGLLVEQDAKAAAEASTLTQGEK
jgi:hypothetical protein